MYMSPAPALDTAHGRPPVVREGSPRRLHPGARPPWGTVPDAAEAGVMTAATSTGSKAAGSVMMEAAAFATMVNPRHVARTGTVLPPTGRSAVGVPALMGNPWSWYCSAPDAPGRELIPLTATSNTRLGFVSLTVSALSSW